MWQLPLYDECGRYSQRVKLFQVSCLQDCKSIEQGTGERRIYHDGRAHSESVLGKENVRL